MREAENSRQAVRGPACRNPPSSRTHTHTAKWQRGKQKHPLPEHPSEEGSGRFDLLVGFSHQLHGLLLFAGVVHGELGLPLGWERCEEDERPDVPQWTERRGEQRREEERERERRRGGRRLCWCWCWGEAAALLLRRERKVIRGEVLPSGGEKRGCRHEVDVNFLKSIYYSSAFF